MNHKNFVNALGFSPKENTTGVFSKIYPIANNYVIEINLEEERIHYGETIQIGNENCLKLGDSYKENLVTLECVNRLLEKGYKPENIILEKMFPLGHNSGRLDILVTREDGTAYLMIECKTFGKEFQNAFKKLNKDGGQLFTYFQQDKNADVLMLYASELKENDIEYKSEIIHIEEDYRQTNNVEDFFDRWNKLPVSNGIFEDWVRPYCFESKALTPENLREIKPEDSSFIFNRFLEILRHNVVSDKPNAFNKIFTLFLCKILDEKNAKPNEELAFQWFYTQYQYEGIEYPPDNHISFQKRLTDLYRKGMKEFLDKEVTDISDADFARKYGTVQEDIRKQILDDLTEVRLKKNNEFAIKEVFDDDSFNENAKVVKEVVELLQRYKIRYSGKQQYLSDFFELLLTTGLKQESGQFFTPVPVAQFVIKSLPIDTMLMDKLKKGIKDECLPHVIDYAAGSGHFITEGMHEIQRLLSNLDSSQFFGDAKKTLDVAKITPYDWAYDYIYGIEKDYRLVKVGKVGCYLHGDGLAKVIHSDGLGSFTKTKDYRDLLIKTHKDFPKENKQFDILVSNPPYSVSAFKNNAAKFYGKEDFELYNSLTDNSSEIECLFVERMKQLLKDGGAAGIILPSSILSNEGIYTKAREIILQYFKVIAITELGSNTFMATGTNTVVLFLRRRDNYDSINLKKSIEQFFNDWQDVTRNGIEKPISKYVNYVWGNITFDDYVTLLKNEPNDALTGHEMYKEYRKKINAKTEKDFWQKCIETEKEKLLYFILAYPQNAVLVKTGEKDAEKRFLGYEFSNRRGSEGIHPIQRGKTIAECTKLFDDNVFDNPEKASTYIYKAFLGDYETPIHESLKNNISRVRLVDMLTFDRSNFAKNISTAIKKKVKIESKWDEERLDALVTFQNGLWMGKNGELKKIKVLRNTNFKLNNGHLSYEDIAEIDVETKQLENKKLEYGDVILEKSGGSDTQAIGRVVIFNKKDNEIYSFSNFCSRIRVLNKEIVNPIYLWAILHEFYKHGGTIPLQNGVRLLNIDLDGYKSIKIPLPPLEIQQKIVSEIEVLEKKEEEAKEKIETLNKSIEQNFKDLDTKANKTLRLSDTDIFDISIGKRVLSDEVTSKGIPVFSANVFEPFGFIDKYLITDFETSSVLWGIDGDWMVNYIPADKPFYPTDHCGVLRIKKDILVPKYLAWLLNEEGKKIGFSRTLRASIDRVQGINIKVPPLPEQQKIVSKIEKIEIQIKELEQQLAEIPQQKESVLKKYL